MYQIKLSIRDLVEAVYMGGDLMTTTQSADRANLGSRIHRMLQKQATGDYQSEVYLNDHIQIEEFEFIIEGRADGIYTENDQKVIEEIKTTYVPYDDIHDDHLVHFAQAYFYGYMYAKQQSYANVYIKLTYYQLEDEKTKVFIKEKTFEELETFCMQTIMLYLTWAKLKKQLQQTAKQTLQQLMFPFPTYREGQRTFAVAVYKAILDSDTLFAQAPTGIGKTISTLFPALKAIGEGKCEKIFYLCAKTITAQVAHETLKILYKQDVHFKSIALTAKDKLCFLEKRNCDPNVCPYAKGYYDRSKKAVYELIQTNDFISKEVITNCAQKHQICPFELSLDASLYAEVIICDYNYVFDPRVYLKRYFEEKGNYIFLVDEAHNLVDRAREMYSAMLVKTDFQQALTVIPKQQKILRQSMRAVSNALLDKRKQCEIADNHILYTKSLDEQLLMLIERFCEHISAYFQSEHDDQHDEELKQLYFDSVNFRKIADFYDDNFITYYQSQGSDCSIKQFCMNPVNPLKGILKKGRSTIFFSATLSPIDYYLSLLGGNDNTKRLSLPSPFPKQHLCCLINDVISTRYANRSASLSPIVQTIYAAVCMRTGNYIIFAPSYSYMKQIYEMFTTTYPQIQVTIQQQNMSEQEKEIFLNAFNKTDELHLYFCVIGGMFSEGIDLKEDRLIGAIIIGVGLAQINIQQDLIKDHFQEEKQMGFAYAYQFPGMNKVLQSAGRVIRSHEDKGMVLFIDERYTTSRYRSLLPTHFQHYQLANTPAQIMHHLDTFWKDNL